MKLGWKTQQLQSLCENFRQDIVDGPFGSELQRKDYVTNGIPVLKIQNIKSFSIALKKMDYVTPSKFQELRRHSYRNGDIVLTKLGDPLGASAIVEELNEGLIVADLVRIRAQKINTKYLCYHLNSPSTSEFINSMQKGTTRPRVTLSVVRELPISFPPLPEQNRIVSILDEAFEGIAAATANAEKNLSNARELFDRYLQTVFTVQGKGWVVKQLGDLATFRNGINFTKSSKGQSVRIVGVKDFQQHFYAPVDDLESVITDGKLPDTDYLKQNDILFVRSNGNLELIGRSVLIGELSEKTTFSGFTIRARLNDASMYPEYLCHYLKSGIARRTMIDGGNGVNIKSLNQTTLSELAIPVPPTIKEQKAVVNHLESLSSDVQRLESVYQQKLDALAELKKSILHQAFTGQLH